MVALAAALGVLPAARTPWRLFDGPTAHRLSAEAQARAALLRLQRLFVAETIGRAGLRHAAAEEAAALTRREHGARMARAALRQLQEEEGSRRAWVGDVEEDLRARLGALQRCEAGEAAGRSELAVAEGQARTQLEVGRGDGWVVFWRRRQLELEELEHRQPVLQGESYARLHLLQVMDCQHRWVYPPYYLGYYP